jgi:DNA mismatch repair protein MutS2
MNNAEKHCETLEFNTILSMLAECAVFEDARSKSLKIRPIYESDSAVKQITLTDETHHLVRQFGFPSVRNMNNCITALHEARLGSSLTLRELLDVLAILKNMRILRIWRKNMEVTNTKLDLWFDRLFLDQEIENKLSSSIVSDEALDDNASSALADIRRKIRQAGLNIRSHLDAIIRSSHNQKMLQETVVSIRDGRFVVPIKAEYKNEFKGYIHDTSSSGATFFIEPMSVVELNNEIKILENKERAEIERIIAELSALVGQVGDRISDGFNAAVDLDVLFAKARFAAKLKATTPILLTTGVTILKQARHPLLPHDKVVPIDLTIGTQESKTLVITGPNTGGKTVALKTLGLLTMMALSGLMIPADPGSSVSVYRKVLSDIGDEQSIEQSLSTFSGHMKNIISIMDEADDMSLVLLDELGAGTDPVEGAALAVSILEHFKERKTIVAATTHYAEVKLYALDTPGVMNAGCEFDVQTLQPTYRLITGIPGKSNAFSISEKLGLDFAVIERAKSRVSTENARFEDIIGEIEATRQQLEREREIAAQYKLEAESISKEIKTERKRLDSQKEKEMEQVQNRARRILEETRILAELIISDLEAVKKEQDARNFSELLARTIKDAKVSLRDLETIANPVSENSVQIKLPRPLVKGDIVFVKSLNKEGIVLKAPQGDTVMVQAGILKTSVPVGDIVLGGKRKTKDNKRGRIEFSGESKASRSIVSELNLRGKDSSEALYELDKFLDDAVMSGIKNVRIIHGKGTGVLRSAVSRHLKGHKSVLLFRLGRYGEGEDGVTIVELK